MSHVIRIGGIIVFVFLVIALVGSICQTFSEWGVL